MNVEGIESPPVKTMRYAEQLRAALIVTSGAFVAGMALSRSSPALPQIGVEMDLSQSQSSWLVSLVPVGGLAGCFPAGWLMTVYGRRGALMRLGVMFCIAWMLLCVDFFPSVMFLGRFLTGFCTGAYLVIIPTFVAEIAHPSQRGKLGALIQVMITLGVLATFVVGALVSWRTLSFFCFLASVLSCALMTFLSETPAYLMQIGDVDGARRTLKSLRPFGYDGMKQEFADLESSVSQVAKADKDIDFSNPEFYRPLMVSIGLMLNQQLSGVNNVIFYSSTILNAGMDSVNENVQSIMVALSQVLVSVPAMILVERLGRRSLLLVSNVICFVALGITALFFYWKSFGPDNVENLAWMPMFGCIAFIVGFSLALGPVPWLMMGELFPLRFRGAASGIASAVNWSVAFLTTKSFATSMNLFGLHGTFLTYCACLVLGLVFVWRCVPETKGKSFAQIASSFEGVVHVA
ncbi:unnamed protein product [Notodromas monacha]|uniref:Major facilitator superfamily (MFS) profile domain-containing protein n=1 Tax=Notodromas monacha TaxID=399045 RepID=A0A7R9BFU2_9CRUS|nr:unnamed protein product [Notodromas monacha]CAG0914666.1 unnamed protein product [Notodromas monacha]